MKEKIIYHRFDTSIGQMLVAESHEGLCRLCLPGEKKSFFRWAAQKYPGAVVEEGCSELLSSTELQLKEYLLGKRKDFSVTLDLKGTVFQRRVWHVLMRIPYGSTASYKEVAEGVGSPAAARAVGQANNRTRTYYRALPQGGGEQQKAGGIWRRAGYQAPPVGTGGHKGGEGRHSMIKGLAFVTGAPAAQERLCRKPHD